MEKEITIKLPRKIVIEILRHLPPSEIKKIEKKLEVEETKKVPVFKISSSPFFGRKPVDLGKTWAEKIDKIIAMQI